MSLQALGWSDARQRTFGSFSKEQLVPGRVISEHRTHYQVATEFGELPAVATGRLRSEAAQRSDLPGVGDFVALRLAPSDGPATVEAVLPRTSALVRKAVGQQCPQLLAANIDVIFIVTGLDGDFNLERLQRYLVLAHDSGATPVIVVNKADLPHDASATTGQIARFAPAVPIHTVSARAGTGVDALEQYFSGNHTVALVGSSGAGKSTLTNWFLGHAAQATGEVRGHDSRGRHTTTHRQLFLRPEGGAIIDTPGMRGLEVWTTEQSVEPDFTDIENLALQCKFRNCGHGSEPACAVRAAVERGEVEAARVATFVERTLTAKRGRW